jgi:Tfp pilus assembly protein PilN
MVGIGKTQLERVEQLIDAAGLSIAAITSTGLAMAGELNQADRDTAMLLLQSNGGEMVVRQNGNVKILRHVPFAMNGHGIPALAPLGAELRRTIALGAAGSANREVALMNGVGLGREQLSELSDRAGVSLRAADEMKLLGLSRDGALASGADAAEGYIFPAVSLALAGNKPSALPLDFAHSKLAPPPVKRFSRQMVYAVVIGALIVIGLAALYWDVSVQQSKLDAINANIDKMKPTLATAQHVVDRVNYAEGFLNARPAMLDCVKQLSLTLPESDRIWVETLSVIDSGKCTLSGKATDEPTVLALVEQMKRNSKFSGVDLKDVHEADQRTHEWTYSLNFNFNLAE